jgi:membrane protein required for colicin V production
MVWVDIAIIFLLAIYAIGGITRGFRQEVYSIIFLIIGFMVAWFFCQDFALLLPKLFHTQSTRLAISFLVLVSITVVVGGIVKWLMVGGIKKTGLSLIDRLGGLLTGLVHGMVIVFILVVIAGLTPLSKDHWWQQSRYLPPFQSVAVFVKGIVSSKLATFVNYHKHI